MRESSCSNRWSGNWRATEPRRLLLLCALLPILTGCVERLGGAFTADPEDAEFLLGAPAKALLDEAYADIAPGALRDFHTHVLAHGGPPEHGWVNPRLLSWRHPLERWRNAIYFSASGVTETRRAEAQYLARLVRLIRAQPRRGKHYLLAFDQIHDAEGRALPDRSPEYVSNAYVVDIARRHPDLFQAAMSVHPYRPDAAAEINRWADQGVRLLKWLPNVHGIDPADPRLAPLYRLLAARGIALLSHIGESQAMDGVVDQEYGNPLRLRAALDAGVTVIMAHAGSLGESRDLDNPDGGMRSNFELFLRLMNERRYRGLAWGELSATTQANRVPEAINGLLQRPDLHRRLVNGSDYPLPAVNVVIQLDPLVDAGLLQAEQAAALREIYGYNPIAFDHALKRALRLPGTSLGFPASVFTGNGLLEGPGSLDLDIDMGELP